MTELLWAFLPPRNRMDVRAPCKGQRAAETTGRTELFVAADVGGLPGETEERRLMGNSRAKNTQARAWGGAGWATRGPGDGQPGPAPSSLLPGGGTPAAPGLTWPV